MRSRLVIGTVLVAVCGAASSAGAAGVSVGGVSVACGPASARTLAGNGGVRIYAVGHQVYGCSRRTGRVTALGSDYLCIRSLRVGTFAVAGGLVAYGAESCGVDTGSSSVIVRRLSDGKVLVSSAAITGTLGVESYSTVGSVVLRADGAVGWIASGRSIVSSGGGAVEVHTDSRGSARLVDHGPGIAIRSLRLRHSTMSWRHGSAVRTTTLH